MKAEVHVVSTRALLAALCDIERCTVQMAVVEALTSERRFWPITDLIAEVYRGAREPDWPEKNIHVAVHHLRQRGFQISCIRGMGYCFGARP